MSTLTPTGIEEEKYYHIYNRGNGGVPLFYQDQNYTYFLKKYDTLLADYMDIYAFSLLPDHFHLMVRIKSKYDFVARKDFPSFRDLEELSVSEIINELFRRFFMSYSKSINNQLRRRGSLFPKTFKKERLDTPEHFTNFIAYIHQQPSRHGISNDLDYPWSSYGHILLPKTSKLQKDTVLEWFGNREDYIKFHMQEPDFNPIQNLIIEES